MKLTESAAILLASTKSSRSSLGERLGNWGMATQATLASAFTKAAIRFNVSESDYLVLGTQGIATFEALAYRGSETGRLGRHPEKPSFDQCSLQRW